MPAHMATSEVETVPEDPEGPPSEVRILHERHVLCAAESYAAVLTKSGQRLGSQIQPEDVSTATTTARERSHYIT